MASLNDMIASGMKAEVAQGPNPIAWFPKNKDTYMRVLIDFNPEDRHLEEKVLMSRAKARSGFLVHTRFPKNADGSWGRKEEVPCWAEYGKRCPYCAGEYSDFRLEEYFATPIYLYNVNFNNEKPDGSIDEVFGWQKILFMPFANSPYGELANHAKKFGSTTDCDFIVTFVKEGKKWVYRVTYYNQGVPFEAPDLEVFTPDEMRKRIGRRLCLEATLDNDTEQQAQQQVRQAFMPGAASRKPPVKVPTPPSASANEEQDAFAPVSYAGAVSRTPVQRLTEEVASEEQPAQVELDDSERAYMDEVNTRKARVPSRVNGFPKGPASQAEDREMEEINAANAEFESRNPNPF